MYKARSRHVADIHDTFLVDRRKALACALQALPLKVYPPVGKHREALADRAGREEGLRDIVAQNGYQTLVRTREHCRELIFLHLSAAFLYGFLHYTQYIEHCQDIEYGIMK